MILYGTNPIAWSNDDDQTIGHNISFEQCLAETAQIGFDALKKAISFQIIPLICKRHLGLTTSLSYLVGGHLIYLPTLQKPKSQP